MRKLIGSFVVLVALSVVGSSSLAPFAAAQSKPKDPTVQKDKDKSKDAKDKVKAKAGYPTFEVYKDAGGDFRFRLKDSDGTILAIASKGYDSKEAVTKVIDNIKSHAAKAKVEETAEKKDK